MPQPRPPVAAIESAHGNPTLRLQNPAPAGQVVTVADQAGRALWRSHPLAGGCDAVRVDVRGGRFVGAGRGWSVLPPGAYTVTACMSTGRDGPDAGAAPDAHAATSGAPAEQARADACAAAPGGYAVAACAPGAQGADTDAWPAAAGRLQVTAQLHLEADFAAPQRAWLPHATAWHCDGSWRPQPGPTPGIVPVARRAAKAHSGASHGECAYLFVDAAMHAVISARFTAPGAGSAAAWGLIARHYNDGNHIRLTLRRAGAGLTLRLERRAAAADPGSRPRVLATAQVAAAAPGGELRWHFNGTRHEVALDGAALLSADDGFMGGVEIVGLFAEADATAPPSWHSFAVASSQWVAKHVVRRGAYAAVVRAGNIHRLHLTPAPAPQPAPLLPAAPNPRTNLFWESGLQVGHIGGSEIKFTQGAALDLLAQGPVADLVRWRGPMPRLVEQDADLRGYARGSAAFYDDRIVVADWVAVRVRRSVGPDFDLLARALTGPARFAPAAERRFRDWELPVGSAMATVAAAPCRDLFPAALAFPLRLGGAAWHLIAAVGGLNNVGGSTPARAFGWQCQRRLTASHDLRVAPTAPGTEYGFWIACTWLPTADTGAAEAAALHLRDEFQHPARLTPHRGALVQRAADREQPAALLALAGCFDRGLGAYRLQAEEGSVRFTFDPGPLPRHQPAFLVEGLAPAAAAPAGVAASADGKPLASDADYRWQPWPSAADAAVLVQLRRNVTAPATLELRQSDRRSTTERTM